MLFRLGVKEDLSEFFNYEAELKLFIKGLRDPLTRMIVVKGVRRIGKSSLIHVGLKASRQNLYVVFDARAVPEITTDTIHTVFSRGVRALLERVRKKALAEILSSLLERIEGVSIAGITLRLRERESDILLEIINVFDRIAEKEDEPLILVFDEAQEFTVIRGFDKLLAHIYDYHPRIKLVLAGSEVGLLDRLLGRKKPKAALYGRPYLEISLKRLSYEKSVEFLEKGFKELNIDWPKTYIEEAAESLDGIPGWLTYYGYTAYTTHSHKEALRRTIEEGSTLVRRELEQFLAQRQQAKTRYMSILRCLSIKPMKWSELKSCLETMIRRRLNNSQYTRYLKELQDYSFILKVDDEYQLADPLIQHAAR